MHQFFFAFGEFDGVSVVEFPNNESCAACAVTLSGAGANTTLQTTYCLPRARGRQPCCGRVQCVTGISRP